MATGIALALIIVSVLIAIITIVKNRARGKCTGCPYCNGCSGHKK